MLLWSWFYLAAIVAVLIARYILAELTWLSALLLYVPPICYGLPLLVLFPVAATRKDAGSLFILGVASALTLGPVMGAVAHDPFRPTQAGDKRVRLLSYNIHSGHYGFAPIADHVVRYRPDVVVFTEARELRAIDTLPSELRGLFRGWTCASGDDVFVASRWPIIAREGTPSGLGNGRSRVRASIRSPYGVFHAIGVHYYTHIRSAQELQGAGFPAFMRDSASARLRQTRELLEAVSRLDGPVLLAGDFNNPPAGVAYALLRRHFKDSHRRSGWGWGYTFPSTFPVWRIDYIFYDSWWNIVRTEVGGAAGSDHRPVFAEFSLDGNNNGT